LKSIGDDIEPILLVFVGGHVLILALVAYLPMWQMAPAAKG
jgi:MSHA biogenesis protein MshG